MNILNFLKKLQQNNHKEWFDANRKEYETARGQMQQLVGDIIKSLAVADPSIAHLAPKDCLFRINRDVRFSKNKDPYKTHFGAFICAAGKKSTTAGYYLHIEPGASFVGGGLYMPEPAQLGKIRQEIDYNLDEFLSVLKDASFKKQFGSLQQGDDIKLVRMPKGYEPDHPAAEWLKLKSFIVMKKLPDSDITSSDIGSRCTAACKALKPLVEFLNKAVDE
jgi:uncharacterized protein (TIGR02453 family)